MVRQWTGAAALAVALGILYTVTPLTVCVAAVGAVVLPRLIGDLEGAERRWTYAIVGAAIVIRLLAIGAVFVRNVPLHDDQFVGAPSGDEAYSMSRALRTRDIVHESPAAGKYDYVVAYDEYGRNSFITALSALEIVFGPAPYALRTLNALLTVIGALLLYRVCRDAFGWVPAAGGLLAILFWPTLFAWSVSLLKEPLYFLLTTLILTAAIRACQAHTWRSRALAALLGIATAALVRDLRPGAVALAAAGIATGLGALVLARSPRRLAVAAVAVGLAAAVLVATPRAQHLLIERIESAAKTHTGHVFTVGHDYKLLDAGFYFNPATPASSSLTLTPGEAARFVVRAVTSFFVVPAPWQLRSARELAYMPEQVAWYALLAMLPIGIVAGWRRNALVTCLLVGTAVPTAVALAFTNGNVGTLLRLRGLVLPPLLWIGALGFCAMLGTAGQPRRRGIVDDNGRLFGRLNLFDATVAAFVVVLLPIAYGTYLLFRTPTPRIESVTSVPITREERRLSGGSSLMAKLKVRGDGLRPMLRASLDDNPTLGFVFEGPHSADVLVGVVPPGRHDFILYDGVQEVARLPKSVEIGPVKAPRVKAPGVILQMEKAVAESLGDGSVYPQRPNDSFVKLGPPRQDRDGTWQRRAELLISCDADPNDQGCVVGGFVMRGTPLPALRIAGPSGASLLFQPTEVLPEAAPATAAVQARFSSAPEIVRAVRVGDRDDCLDDRAAVITAANAARAGAGDIDVTMRLGIDPSPDGWTYRGRLLKSGARIPFTTDAYVLEATILSQPKPQDDHQ